MLPKKQSDGTYSTRAWLVCSGMSVPMMFVTLFAIGHVLVGAPVSHVGIATAICGMIQLVFVPIYKATDDLLRKPPHRLWPLAICVTANLIVLTAGIVGWVAIEGVIPWAVAGWLVLIAIGLGAATPPFAVKFSRMLNKT